LARDFKFKGFNEKAFTQPLGRISGAANEFQKSLDASNARVIAFGASAGLIFTVEKAFTSLVKSTIDVQKSLTDINVILNVSTSTLDQFGNSLFDIAKNTGQTFDVVAQAATELSRQGLGLEETLKRTQDALILTRLSGLDTVSAVEALTATINSFNKAGLDSTVIINKLANVDAAFAVSSGDLAEAIKRVGSSAADAGVDFDELLAIVTSVQQTTARGGAVIGNSLKTIFTRIQRTDTLDQLEQIGIKVRDLEGNTLPAIQVLSNLSNTFNTLADSQKAQVAETVGGVFQINILKAALADLGKEYSVYDRALQTASNSTDQAIQRNEALNQTLSALINQTFQNLTKLSASVGEITLGPTFKGTLELLNKGLESLSTDSETVGGKIGKGILEGIGTFISGPGVILLTAVFGKLLLNLGKFASQSLQTLLSVNSQAEQRVQIQAKINEVLAQEPGLVAAIYNKQISVLELENRILDVIRLQTLERERAATISTAVAGNLVTRGVTSKGGSLKVKSGGFIPNFSAQEIYGALAGGYTPGNIRKMNIPGQGNVTYNSAETVKNFPGMSQPAIMPPQDSKAGKNYKKQFSSAHGFNPYANRGFVPNFASYNINGQYYKNAGAVGNAIFKGKISKEAAAKAGYVSTEESNLAKAQQKSNSNSIFSPTPLLALNKQGSKDGYTFRPAGKPPLDVRFPVVGFNRNSIGFNLDSLKENLDTVINKSITDFAGSIYKTRKLSPPIDLPSTVETARKKSEGLAGALEGTVGGIFESAFRAAFGRSVKASTGGTFDVNSIPKDLPLFFPGSPIGVPGDFKNSDSSGNRESMALKILKSQRPDLLKFLTNKTASRGFIPNFTALDNAIGREVAAGTATSRIRIGKDSRLTSSANPLGLGVYNTKDEPKGLGQGIQRYGSKAKTAGAAAGFIPNFAGLSFNPGGLGALDPALANREIGAEFARILAQLKKQEITLQQANTNLKRLSTDYGLAADSQNRFNQILQSRGSQYASSAKNATLALDNTKKGFEKLSSAGLALSLVLPIALQTVNQFNQGNKKLQVGIDAFSTFLSLTAAGATLGPAGAVGGAAAGAGLGLYQYFEGLKNLKLEKLKEDIQLLQDEFNNTSTSVNQVIPLVEKYKEAQASALPDTQKAEALANIQNQISENLGKIGPEFSKAILEAIKNQNYDQVGFIINKSLSKKSAEVSNLGAEALFQNIKGQEVTSKTTASGISRALTGLQTSSGKNIIQELAAQEGGLQKISAVSTNLEGLLQFRGQLKGNLAKNQKIANQATKTTAAGLGQARDVNFKDLFGGEEAKKAGQEIVQTQTFLKQNLIDILGAVSPLYQATEEGRIQFEKLSEAAKDTNLSQEAADKVIKDAKQYLDNILQNQQKIDKLFKNNISTIEQYILGFKNNTLNAKDAQAFYKEYFNLKNNPLEMLARSQNDLNMSVATTILNEDSRNRVIQQLTIEEDKLRQKLTNRQITEDQYNKALEGLKDEIILEQRKLGTIFAEDFRGGRQQAREARALAGQTQLQDFAGAFFDEFDNSAADSFRQAQLGAKDTANTIKSEFNNAFLSFANGTATASDAFTKMALNISDKIQQLAIEFSTNQVFGALFGTTSNIFGGGGGGGGIGGFFGSLFKSKGGMIKGYSTGGNVVGGSGNKDDIPAMLSGGEYVIRKSAVNKYGQEYLRMLNEGKVEKRFLGGAMGIAMAGIAQGNPSMFQNIAPLLGINLGNSKGSNQNVSTNTSPAYTSPTSSVGMRTRRRDREDNYFKYGGRVQRFAAGGETSYLGTNVYRYNDPLFPTGGQEVFSSNLSARALIDPNNPQNRIRQDRERALYDYLNYVEGVRLDNERALQENVALNKKVRDEYNQQKSAKSRGAWMSFGLGLLGAGASQFSSMGGFKGLGSSSKYGASAALGGGSAARQNYSSSAPLRYSTPTPRANGGYIRGFANGGSSGKDDIPALLMGGEFVMRKEAVNMYGKKFFDDLNSGRARKFAEGGSVGGDNSASSANYSPTNNVNITVNLTQEKIVSEQKDESSSTNEDRRAENERTKQLAAKVKDQVLQVITEQQRPGGLLGSNMYRKRS
jgi:TP901 family phage tail tape measure protein